MAMAVCSGLSRMPRIFSPMSVKPGSCTSWTGTCSASSRSRSSRAWVLLRTPSPAVEDDELAAEVGHSRSLGACARYFAAGAVVASSDGSSLMRMLRNSSASPWPRKRYGRPLRLKARVLLQHLRVLHVVEVGVDPSSRRSRSPLMCRPSAMDLFAVPLAHGLQRAPLGGNDVVDRAVVLLGAKLGVAIRRIVEDLSSIPSYAAFPSRGARMPKPLLPPGASLNSKREDEVRVLLVG
jgi:hypothetical protein